MWLNYLVKSTLYKLYIKVDMSALDQNEPVASERIDMESDVLAARQHMKATFNIDCATRTTTATTRGNTFTRNV
jgi:hypothetical protein